MSIRIFYDYTGFRYRSWRKTGKILRDVIEKEKKVSGDINIIITDDEKLRKINGEFLEHDYYTDVITFNYNTEDVINGEIYISLDTVRTNSVNYNVSLRNELTRVMIHGILHLTGYNDRNDEEKQIIRRMEDYWLKIAGE